MPTQTLKKNKNASRVFTIPSVAVPVVLLKNVKKNITYKVPINLLQPKNLLKAKLKNRANATKKAENARRERLAAQARFAAMLRNSRAKNAAATAAAAAAAAHTPVWLSPFVSNNAGSSTKTVRRGPGARGTGVAGAGNGGLVSLPAPRTLMPSNLFSMLASRSANSTVRKANLLRMEHLASKAAPAPAPARARKPVGKFWKKEGTNNSNSSSSNNNSD